MKQLVRLDYETAQKLRKAFTAYHATPGCWQALRQVAVSEKSTIGSTSFTQSLPEALRLAFNKH